WGDAHHSSYERPEPFSTRESDSEYRQPADLGRHHRPVYRGGAVGYRRHGSGCTGGQSTTDGVRAAHSFLRSTWEDISISRDQLPLGSLMWASARKPSIFDSKMNWSESKGSARRESRIGRILRGNMH